MSNFANMNASAYGRLLSGRSKHPDESLSLSQVEDNIALCQEFLEKEDNEWKKRQGIRSKAQKMSPG